MPEHRARRRRPDRAARLLLGAGRGRRRVRGRRHLRRGALAARHDGLGRPQRRRSSSGRPRSSAASCSGTSRCCPLIGRIADLRGRTPVLVAALVVFAFGSLVTAAAYDLGSLVAGRFLQGVGGGGLVPVTLALVADLYPADRRGVPLGVVGAVQELGSVIGPLYGAVVLSFGTWRDIFWINLAVGLVLAAAIATLARRIRIVRAFGRSDRRVEASGRSDYPVRRRSTGSASLLLALTLAALLLVMRQPRSLVTSVDLGGPFVPFRDGGSIWFSPIGVVTVVLAVLRSWPGCCSPRSGRWWTCATGGARRARPTSLGAGLLVGRPRRGHPGLRHGRPRGAGVLPGRALVPRRRRGRGRPVRAAQPALRGAAGAARRVRAAAGLGCAAGQLLRRRGADRRPGRHPDLRADHRRRRVADQGRAGAGRVPGRAAGRRAAWAAYSPGGCRPGSSPRSGWCWPPSASG